MIIPHIKETFAFKSRIQEKIVWTAIFSITGAFNAQEAQDKIYKWEAGINK